MRAFWYLCGTDTVAKLSPFTHETRRLSDGRIDGVEAARSHGDAVDANLKFGNVRKQTLSQHQALWCRFFVNFNHIIFRNLAFSRAL